MKAWLKHHKWTVLFFFVWVGYLVTVGLVHGLTEHTSTRALLDMGFIVGAEIIGYFTLDTLS